MKATVEVSDRREADTVRAGLEDPETRAFVVITGVLAPLSSRARERVMKYVTDRLSEDREINSAAQSNGNPT